MGINFYCLSRRPLSVLSDAAAKIGRNPSASLDHSSTIFSRPFLASVRAEAAGGKRSCSSVVSASMSSSSRRPPPPQSTANEVFVDDEPGIGTFTYKWPRPGLTADVVLVAEPGVAPESAVAVTTAAASPSSRPPSSLLLIERKRPPGQGLWALPGGFVNEGEGLERAAERELKEETGVDVVAVGTEGTVGGRRGEGAPSSSAITIEQTRSYGDAGRDPRGWTVTVAFAGVVRAGQRGHREAAAATAGSDDAADARWWPLASLPPTAFDHKVIVRDALRKLLREEEAGEQESPSDFVLDLRAALASEALKGDWR